MWSCSFKCCWFTFVCSSRLVHLYLVVFVSWVCVKCLWRLCVQTGSLSSEVCCCSHLSRTVKACLCRSAWDWIFLKHTDSLTSRFYVQPIFTNSPSLQHAFLFNWMRDSLHSSESLRDWQETPTWMQKFKEGDTRKSCCESGTGGGTEEKAQSQSEALEILYGYVKALSIQTRLWYPQQSKRNWERIHRFQV